MGMGQISRETIDNIKNSNDIVDLAFESGHITSNSSIEVRGNCPSGHASTSKQCCLYSRKSNQFHCFNCSLHGDSIEYTAITRFNSNSKLAFVDAVKYLAERKNIPLANEISQQVAEKYHEKKRVIECLTTVAEIYHQNILQDNKWIDWLQKKYGFNLETIKRFKIGYSNNEKNMGLYKLAIDKGFSRSEILGTGLFKPIDKNTQYSFFDNRIVFPYLDNTSCRYMIGRRTEVTPDNKFESQKFKKLPVFNLEKNNFISEAINNRFVFNQNEIYRSDEIIITEGVADCISLTQNGFASISPVTVKFSKADAENILNLLSKNQEIYICNDNEINESGSDGARAMATELTKAGFVVKMIELPLQKEQIYARSEYYRLK
jgi:DNA primase